MSEISRRGMLAVVGFCTTGCLRTESGGEEKEKSSTTQTKTTRPTASTTEKPAPADQVADIEAQYAQDWANISANITQASLVDEEPAAVQVTVTNNAEEEETVYGELDEPSQLQCDSGPAGPGLVLVPPRATVDRADSDCWIYSDLEWDQKVGSGVAKTTTISPGESVSMSWEIWWTESVESDVCLPSGKYVFSWLFQRRPQKSDLNIAIELSG